MSKQGPGWGRGRPACALQASPGPGPPCASPENFLFFGCRQRDQDFYWEAEWKELEERGCLSLVTAFSRDQVGVRGRPRPGGGPGADSPRPSAPQERKVYVQHRLRELGPLVWELLDHRGAYFYLAG